jgi:outer membrane protein
MKKILLGALVATLPLTAMADTVLGFKVGGGSWTHDPSGSITSTVGGVGTSADLKNDLKLAKKSEGYTYFQLEHPVPLVPNFKYMKTALTSAGSGSATTQFQFNGTTYTTAANLTTKLQLDQTDYILYYELLDNVVSLDLGLNAKMIDGSAYVTDGTTPQTSNFKATVPMLYAAAEIAFTDNFSLGMDISSISVGKNTISDITTKVSYTTDFMLGIEAGVRTQDIKVDVDSVKTSMKFSGAFVGVYFKF